MSGGLAVAKLHAPRPDLCEPILRALPEWFGIESAILGYLEALGSMRTFLAERQGAVVGFLALDQSGGPCEIHVMGVLPGLHRSGVGRALVVAAESAARSLGATSLEVKTLGPSRDHEPYARTRAFYEAMGFVPVEERTDLWGEGNPCLIMRKSLR